MPRIVTDIGDITDQAFKLMKIDADSEQLQLTVTKEDSNDNLLFKTPYGEMAQCDASNEITISAKDTWYEIDGFSTGEVNNVTFQNSKELKVLTAGKYMAHYNVCWENGVSNEYSFRLAINGTTVCKTQSCGLRGTANDVVASSSGGILSLSANDLVTLEVLNNTTSSNMTVHDANVRLFRIG